MSVQPTWNTSVQNIPGKKIQSSYCETKEALFPRGAIVCDVGSSTGVDSLYFLQQGHSVIALDISDTGLELTRKLAQKHDLEKKLTTIHVDLKQGDLPMEDECVDVVFSRLSLHYFSISETKKILQELHRILRPGGAAYIIVKSPDDEEELSFLKNTATEIEPSVFKEGEVTKSRYTKEQWETMLRDVAIRDYTVQDHLEDLTGRGDVTKSGNMEFKTIEVQFSK